MLDWQLPEKKKFPTAPIADVEDARKAVAPLNSNLDQFQLVPRGSNGKAKLTGAALFAHMCSYRGRMLGRAGERTYEGSKHLDLSLGKRQMECIQPSEHELKRGHIIRDAVGDGAALKVARRKLNTIGNMHGHCAVLNGAENLKRMRDDLQLTDAIAEISRGDAAANAVKKAEEEGNLIDGAAAAAMKLEEKDRNVAALTVKEIKSLLFAVYVVTLSASKLRKPDYVTYLMTEMEKDITKYERFFQQITQVTQHNTTAEIPV